MVSARSYGIITIMTLLVGTNRKDVFGILMRKDFTFTRVLVNYAEALVECGNASHVIDTRLVESYESFKNIIIPYYTHNISQKSDNIWTSVTRADESSDDWYWHDGDLYPYGTIQKFAFDDKFTCSGLKYSLQINDWKYRALNCPEKTSFAVCETQTTDPCYYRMMTGILAETLSVTRTLFMSVSTLAGCKNECNKWKQTNSRECWMISYNPSASECYIIEYDVMPNDDQTCSWFTYSPEWDTYIRICYDLNVYDATGTLLLFPACVLPTPPYVETTTRMDKTSSTADRPTSSIDVTTTPTDRTTIIDTTTMIYTSTTPKGTTTTPIDITKTSITPSTQADTTGENGFTTLIDTTTTIDITTSQIDTTITSMATTTPTDSTTLLIDTTSTTMYTSTTAIDTTTTSKTTTTQKDVTSTPKDTFTTPIDTPASRHTTTVTDTTMIESKTITDTTTSGGRRTTEQRKTSQIDTITPSTDTTMLSEDTVDQITSTTFTEDETITDTNLNTIIVKSTTVQIDTTAPRESAPGDTTILEPTRPGNTKKPNSSPETSVETAKVSITSPSTRYGIKTTLQDRKTTPLETRTLSITEPTSAVSDSNSPSTKFDIKTILQDTKMFLETSSISNTRQTSAVSDDKATRLHSKPPTTYTINAVVGTMSTSVHSTTAQTGGTSPAPTWKHSSDPTDSTCKRLCRCGSDIFNYTSIAEILANLRINVKNTSSYRRLFSSATDDRPLSIGIGWSGAAVLILVGTGIFVLDCQRLFQDAMLLCANVRNLFQSSV